MPSSMFLMALRDESLGSTIASRRTLLIAVNLREVGGANGAPPSVASNSHYLKSSYPSGPMSLGLLGVKGFVFRAAGLLPLVGLVELDEVDTVLAGVAPVPTAAVLGCVAA